MNLSTALVRSRGRDIEQPLHFQKSLPLQPISPAWISNPAQCFDLVGKSSDVFLMATRSGRSDLPFVTNLDRTRFESDRHIVFRRENMPTSPRGRLATHGCVPKGVFLKNCQRRRKENPASRTVTRRRKSPKPNDNSRLGFQPAVCTPTDRSARWTSAAFTRSGVIGYCRSRTPTAS